MITLTRWKLVLVLVTTLISIAAGEVAIVVIGLVLSVYVDEMRFRVLFKERREMMGVIRDLHRLSQDQMKAILILEEAVRRQADAIIALQVINEQLRDEVKEQTNRIIALEKTNEELSDKVERLEGEIRWQKNVTIASIVAAILGIGWAIIERFFL